MADARNSAVVQTIRREGRSMSGTLRGYMLTTLSVQGEDIVRPSQRCEEARGTETTRPQRNAGATKVMPHQGSIQDGPTCCVSSLRNNHANSVNVTPARENTEPSPNGNVWEGVTTGGSLQPSGHGDKTHRTAETRCDIRGCSTEVEYMIQSEQHGDVLRAAEMSAPVGRSYVQQSWSSNQART